MPKEHEQRDPSFTFWGNFKGDSSVGQPHGKARNLAGRWLLGLAVAALCQAACAGELADGGQPFPGDDPDAGTPGGAVAEGSINVGDAGLLVPPATDGMGGGLTDIGGSPPLDAQLAVPDQSQLDTAPPTWAPDPGITEFEGFGRNATGGFGGTVAVVTSLADSGPGSLRQVLAQATGPTVVRFQQSGTINLQSTLSIPSNVTLDGRGMAIVITNKGLVIDGKQNIVLVNLAFVNVRGPEDSIMITNGSHDIVIDHCLFDDAGVSASDTDEQISVIFGSHSITISWCKFDHHEKVLLFGNGDAAQAVDQNITVTLHHNHFHQTGRRHPYLRYGKVDMYNNFIQEWELYQGIQFCSGQGNIVPCAYGVRAILGGQVLMQSNRFEFYDWTLALLGSAGAFVEQGGQIQSIGNSAKDSAVITLANTGTVFARPYPATIDPINEAWIQTMKASTGNTI